jgi:tRNA modification GTPase
MSKRTVNESHLVMFVLDGSDVDENDEKIYQLVKDKNILVVVNKTDKGDYKDQRADIYVSAKTGDNLDKLRNLIFERTVDEGVDMNGELLMEERHYEALSRAREKFEFALSNVNNVPLDILAIDIKDGWDALGEISGKTATEEIINDIFSRFCVGK